MKKNYNHIYEKLIDDYIIRRGQGCDPLMSARMGGTPEMDELEKNLDDAKCKRNSKPIK